MGSIPSIVRPRFFGGIALHVFVSLLCCLGVGGNISPAFAADQVTFSWRANPSGDDVVGYRLYFGDASRFDRSGRAKQNFSYDAYIDFTDARLCMHMDAGEVCASYTEEDVECEGLYGENPSCTLYNLEGRYFFAMTAYNTQAESDYTGELSGYFEIPGVTGSDSDDAASPASSSGTSAGGPYLSPEVMGGLQAAFMLLRK